MKRRMLVLMAAVWSVAAACEIAALLTIASGSGMGQRLFILVLLIFSLANAGAYSYLVVRRALGQGDVDAAGERGVV